MYVKYACIYIDDVKVILSTNGFCNIKRYMVDHNADTKEKTWSITIKGTRIKLCRLMAHLFIDSAFDIMEQRSKGRENNKVVIFTNGNSLDLRIDNIQVVTHSESLARHHRVEDDLYLVNLDGKRIDSGRLNDMSAKYQINKGSIHDVLKGINTYCTLNTGEKCIIVKGIDYNVDKVKDRIKELSNKQSRKFKKNEIIIQADITGKTKEITVNNAKKICNEAGLRMCLNGKRKSAGGYLWVPYDVYTENPECIMIMLNEIKKSKFYGSKIKLNKFED